VADGRSVAVNASNAGNGGPIPAKGDAASPAAPAAMQPADGTSAPSTAQERVALAR